MSRSTLDLARAGDEAAFGELIAPHLRELQLHCYRMLGSLADAEDLLQETLTAAWRGLNGFAERSTLRAWLYRIATNRCLNAIRDGKRRAPAEPRPPFEPPRPSRYAEVTWLQPYPDAWLAEAAARAPGPAEQYLARETVELAFVVALQRLPPRQAAALVLHEVLGFSTLEVAEMLRTTASAVKGAVQRARASLDRSEVGSGHRPSSAGELEREREVARRFAQAFTAGDIPGVVELLTDDAWLAMPPAPHEYHGRDAICAFLRASAGWRVGRRLWLVPTRANTQPAFGCYLDDQGGQRRISLGMIVLTVRGDRLSAVTRFLDGDLPQLFGLADPALPLLGRITGPEAARND